MDTLIDSTFAKTFTLGEMQELPQNPPVRQVYYPGPAAGAVYAATWLLVQPQVADPWVAVVSEGNTGVTGINLVAALPDGVSFAAVAEGRGFVIDSRDPDVVEEIPAYPIRMARVCPNDDRVVFADYHDVLAYGPQGVVWRKEGVALEFLDSAHVTEGVLHARAIGSVPHDYVGEVEVRIDLRTGEWSSTDPDAPYAPPLLFSSSAKATKTGRLRRWFSRLKT